MINNPKNTQTHKKSPLDLIPKEWEVKKLGDIGSFSKGKGIGKIELKENGFPCIRYGEIYTVHNFYIVLVRKVLCDRYSSYNNLFVT